MNPASRLAIEDAMAYCRRVTRQRARNFYYGLKLLPEPKRSALYAVYAWMRTADDLADDAVDARSAIAHIADYRAATIAALNDHGDVDDPVLLGIREVARRYPVREEHLHAMLDGQLDDLHDRCYRTFDELHEYCARVASSVGLVCIEIWGYTDPAAPQYALDRGVAFQLTNILRDLVEDYQVGRCYMPADELQQHDLTIDDLIGWGRPHACGTFLLEQINRTASYFERSAPLESMIAPECRSTLWAMTEIYHGILDRMRQDPYRIVLGRRIHLSALHKSAIALRARMWRG